MTQAGIFTDLRERCAGRLTDPSGVEYAMTQIAGQTYFRRASEMVEAGQWWQLQAAEMIAREVRGAMPKLFEEARATAYAKGRDAERGRLGPKLNVARRRFWYAVAVASVGWIFAALAALKAGGMG